MGEMTPSETIKKFLDECERELIPGFKSELAEKLIALCRELLEATEHARRKWICGVCTECLTRAAEIVGKK